MDKRRDSLLEYSRRILSKEYVFPEVLRDKKVADVLIMPDFVSILSAFVKEQKEKRASVLEAIAELKKQGKSVDENRPTIDRVIEFGLMDNAGDFAVEFAKVLNRQSKHPAAIRLYIRQLGMKAYNATIEKLIRDENPDMAELYEQATAIGKN